MEEGSEGCSEFDPCDLEDLAELAAAFEEAEAPDPRKYCRTFAGTPLPDPAQLATDPDFTLRFWSKVLCGIRREECWVWQAVRKQRGYGQFKVRTMMQAHRVAFMLHWKRWPDPDRVLCHSCDNPA